MANDSVQHESFFATCQLFHKVEVIVNFPSNKYVINNIFVIVLNCILIIFTILLNAVSTITISKSPQLSSKPCYFIILIQSTIDLVVGVFGTPLFVIFLASQVIGVSNCVSDLSLRLTYITVGTSMVTLSALTIERYIAILHPYAYSNVTKKRILIYVGSGSALVLFVASLSVLLGKLMIQYFTSAIILPFFVLTAIAYRKIFHVIKSSNRNCQHPDVQALKKTKLLLQEIKQAKPCFTVVMCFAVCLLPMSVALPFILNHDRFNAEAIRIWVATLLLANSSVNSALFFWAKKMLRKEAKKLLTKKLCFPNSVDILSI